jgi:hypothetical protein
VKGDRLNRKINQREMKKRIKINRNKGVKSKRKIINKK